MQRTNPRPFGVGNRIALVEDLEIGHSIGADFGEHRVNGGNMTIAVRIGRIDHVQEQIGRRDFF
jgi:hypothetical protein